MSLQKFRADVVDAPDNNGAIAWRAVWLGGHPIAKVLNCPTEIANVPRVTAYATADADTWFSIPAVAQIRGCRVIGYLTCDSGNWLFNHCYYG